MLVEQEDHVPEQCFVCRQSNWRTWVFQQPAATALTVFSPCLLYFRVLLLIWMKVFSCLNWDSLWYSKSLLKTLMRCLPAWSVAMLLCCSILGMHIFGCKFSIKTETGDTVPDRKNFDSLLWAIVTVFQVTIFLFSFLITWVATHDKFTCHISIYMQSTRANKHSVQHPFFPSLIWNTNLCILWTYHVNFHRFWRRRTGTWSCTTVWLPRHH